MRDALPGDDLSGSRCRANLTYANCRSRKPLVMYPIGSIAGVPPNIDMRTPQVFVELDRNAHRSGTNSSSRAKVAA